MQKDFFYVVITISRYNDLVSRYNELDHFGHNRLLTVHAKVFFNLVILTRYNAIKQELSYCKQIARHLHKH